MTLEQLPAYLYCPDCDDKHFLAINKAVDDSWSAGYMSFYSNEIILAINSCVDLNEVAARLTFSLERWRKRNKDADFNDNITVE